MRQVAPKYPLPAGPHFLILRECKMQLGKWYCVPEFAIMTVPKMLEEA